MLGAMNGERNAELDVFVSPGCDNCARAVRLAGEVDDAYPDLAVRVVDVATAQQPEDVFAVPTFVLNGRVLSLGNPHRADLRRQIEALLG